MPNAQEELAEIKTLLNDPNTSSSLKTSLENIEGLLSDSDLVWQDWKNAGLDIKEIFEVYFNFYTPDKSGAKAFQMLLESQHSTITIKEKRTLIIFKGYEVFAFLKQGWTLEKLNKKILDLGIIARDYNILLEGYGCKIDPKS